MVENKVQTRGGHLKNIDAFERCALFPEARNNFLNKHVPNNMHVRSTHRVLHEDFRLSKIYFVSFE